MHFITADSQPVGNVGRTYYYVYCHNEDGSNWCGVVEDLMPGETEVNAAKFDEIAAANVQHNIDYQTQIAQDILGAVAETPDPNETKQEQAAETAKAKQAQYDATVAEIARWEYPGSAAILAELEPFGAKQE